MNPRRKFTSRNVLIALHDLITVVAAVLVSCYFRFDDHDFALRLPLLLKALPYFLAISCVIFYVFNLTTTKWRFISLVDALKIVKASSLLAFVILVFDYVIIAPICMARSFLERRRSYFTGCCRYFCSQLRALPIGIFVTSGPLFT
jgi:O-antigen biosynthesis protein WbqV